METLNLINYSEKAIVIYGQTKEYKENLKQLGGRFNPYLTINGTKQCGWIFSKRRETEIKNFISSLGGQKFGEVCNTCNFELPTKVNGTPIATPTPIVEMAAPIVEAIKEVAPIVETERPKETNITKVVKAIKSIFKVNYKGIFSQFKSNNSLPILDNVYIHSDGMAQLSDLETTVILTNYFKNKNEGAICLPLEQIKNISGANELQLIINGTAASLGVFKLSGMAASDFPLPCPDDTKFRHVGILERNGIEAVNVAYNYVSKDELRPVMTGIYFDKNGNVVGTDAHKLFSIKAHELTESFIINKKTAKLLSLLSDSYVVYLSDGYIKFVSESGTIISRIIEGNYPNYEAVMPKDNNITFGIDKAMLVKTINEAIKCANKTTKQVRFKFTKNSLLIHASDLDLGLEYSKELAIQSETEFEIGFNGKFLLDILANVTEQNVLLKCKDPNRAALINDNFLLMPVMIKE